jgi:hypothetical protein
MTEFLVSAAGAVPGVVTELQVTRTAVFLGEEGPEALIQIQEEAALVAQSASSGVLAGRSHQPTQGICNA